MTGERRVRRSDQLETALCYQLQACTERAELSAMVLADEHGLLVAASPWEESQSEELAALLPLLAQGQDVSLGFLGAGTSAPPTAVSIFEAAGTCFYLCALGRATPKVRQEMIRARCGVERLLH